ncbi:hypothetical protein ACEPAG_2278 [Sanghuangporus baumii]
MNLQVDPIAIVSSACRLPLGITSPSQLWDALCGKIDPKGILASPDSVPESRHPDPTAFIDPSRVGGAGWLGSEGIELFDPTFFNISPAEAEILRPNTRLALELTWEVLERAGIPPASVRGKNVAVSIGVGTEDGWDLRRFSDDRSEAFDHRWAANSDPSGVSGQVAHYFDFRGPSSVISTACSSGAFALRDGIQALLSEECDLAVVGAITTHFFTAPFDWAASVNVASKNGQCAAFSREADGYVPSEGAVFFVLKRSSVAQATACPILGVIKSLATGHNGATRALATPNVTAQVALTRRALRAAGLIPADVNLLEAHGTGTRLGDAMEAEAFRSVYDGDELRQDAFWVSSSKTLFGHCQAASMLVGILKVLSCFEHRALPPHLVDPLPEFKDGKILIPTLLTPLPSEKPIVSQVCSFGFTGSIASLILEETPMAMGERNESTSLNQLSILPFSAKTLSSLNAQIAAVYEWACQSRCTLHDLGAILSLAREHHPVRLAIVASSIEELHGITVESYVSNVDKLPVVEVSPASAFLNLSKLPTCMSEDDRRAIYGLIARDQTLGAACLLYNKGHNLCFEEIYDLRKVLELRHYLQTFPTYTFDRKRCWKDSPKVIIKQTPTQPALGEAHGEAIANTPERPSRSLSVDFIAEAVASVLRMPAQNVRHDSNIFDLGVDSLNSIELAKTLSQASGITLPVLDLYSLSTVQAIHDFFAEKKHGESQSSSTSQSRFSQADVDAWIVRYGAKLDTAPTMTTKKERSPRDVSVLLTGASGMLGCHVLHDLLSRSEVKQIYCPVRGDAWNRLLRAYSTHGHDASQLVKERDLGRLVVFYVSDLGDELLGCGTDVYGRLLRHINTLVHLAWKLDFNLPVASFQNCVQGVRNLAQLSIAADKHVDYYFISSFSAYFGYEGTFIPEQSLRPDLSACLDQGYAVSKLISEHALLSIHRAHMDAFNLQIVRIGQICGNSKSGEWSLNEMVPMMIKSLPALKMLPRSLPDVSWIPSDVCAAVISDFVSSPSSESPTQILHIANPRITTWPVTADLLATLAEMTDGVSLVSLRVYVDAIRNAPVGSEIAIARLLPYFSGVAEKGDLPKKYASLEVKRSLAFSPALASCPEVNEEFLKPIVRYLLGAHTQINGTAAPPPSRTLEPPVLLFGPWSEAVSTSVTVSSDVKNQVETAFSLVRKEIQYIGEKYGVFLQNLLLGTLIGQVSAYEELKRRGVIPRAVLGYCFGEYAASVCAGILSLEVAVDIIVRRAVALRDVKGSMLNVFAELDVVRRQLLKLPYNMEIAIYAGPNHYVLSGPPEHVTFAQSAFQKSGVKTKLVETSIPFHSAVMDGVVTSVRLPSVDCAPGTCTYISGLTGSSIGGKRLGPKYWLRHMRDPVMFVDAVRFIQKHFPSSPLVDVGPGRMLSSIVARYRWEGCQIFSLKTYLDADFSTTSVPAAAPAPSLPATSVVAEQEDHVQSSISAEKLAASSPATGPAPSTAGRVVSVPSSCSSKNIEMDRNSVEEAVANILVSDFGFKDADPQDLLSKSFLMLGLQSIDFVAFSEKVQDTTGLVLPASSFASDSSLLDVLSSLTN